MILLIILLFPFLEGYMLYRFTQAYSLSMTMGLLAFSFFLGAYLMKGKALEKLRQAQIQVMQGRGPQAETLSGAGLFVGGLLLMIPGFLTDFIGLMLIVPLTRNLIFRVLQRKLTQMATKGNIRFRSSRMDGFSSTSSNYRQDDDIIEVEARPIEEAPQILPKENKD